MNESAQSALIDVFSSNAAEYDQGVEFFQPVAAKLVQRAGVRPGDRVLDVGCGRGAVLFQAAEAVGPTGSVVGIDLAEGMVTQTAADAKDRGFDNVTVQQMDGFAPDFPTGSFDRILGSMSIIMIPNLADAFGHYHALLSDGGVLGFTAPALGASPTDWRMGPMDWPSMLAEADLSVPGKANLDGALEQFAALDAHSLLGDLRTAGFTEPYAVDEAMSITARSGKAFVDWTFTHGMRVVWGALREDRRMQLAAEMADRIDQDRDADGVVSYPFPMRVFLAAK